MGAFHLGVRGQDLLDQCRAGHAGSPRMKIGSARSDRPSLWRVAKKLTGAQRHDADLPISFDLGDFGQIAHLGSF